MLNMSPRNCQLCASLAPKTRHRRAMTLIDALKT
jgi:hypothetical protein